jgi:hypothetical protein
VPDDFYTRKAATEEDYEVFGLTSSATLDEVTSKYRVLSKKNHPDAIDGSAFLFKQIGLAYERIRADKARESTASQSRPPPTRSAPSRPNSEARRPPPKSQSSTNASTRRQPPRTPDPPKTSKRERVALVVAIVIIVIVGIGFASLAHHSTGAGQATTTVTVAPTNSVISGTGNGATPTPPFTVGLTGFQSTSSPNGKGQVQVVLSMHLQNAAATPLTVTLIGSDVKGGGIAMSSGKATLGSSSGVVTSVSGGRVTADLGSPTPMTLTLALQVDQNTGALSGTATGTAKAQGGGRSTANGRLLLDPKRKKPYALVIVSCGRIECPSQHLSHSTNWTPSEATVNGY